MKIDIVAGTSIGGVNAAIIAGNKNEKYPEQFLEEFWLEIADSFVDLNDFSPSLFSFFEQILLIIIILLPQHLNKRKMNH